MSGEYGSFREFYPAYLAEHREKSTRRLHFVGTLPVLVAIGVMFKDLLTGRIPW
jgi:hypothetical protein